MLEPTERIAERLNRDQIRTAIFIDYEGNKDKPPTLLGWRVDSENFSVIVEPAFETCANRFRAKNTGFRASMDIATELVAKACAERRVIVSWSEHDLHLLRKAAPNINTKHLVTVYRNALKTAKPWHGRTFGHAPQIASLAYFSSLFGLTTPDAFGAGIVGNGLTHLRKQLSEGRTYAELTPLARSEWVAIVKHNRYDLMNMEEVLWGVLAE